MAVRAAALPADTLGGRFALPRDAAMTVSEDVKGWWF
jgi:hypothetical protein